MRVIVVAAGEEASAHQRNAERTEVIRRGDVIAPVKLFVWSRLLAFDIETRVFVVACPRKIAAYACAFDSGDRTEVAVQPAVKAPGAGALLVVPRGRREFCGESMLLLKAGIEMQKIQQAPQHQTSSD